jgi:phosphatidylglycerol:prolipoprotein diacylglycerol transferase
MHPVFFHLGNFPIHSYGVCVALGFLVGLTLATRRAKSAGLPAETIANLGVWLIVAGMLGGKLFHVIFFWNDCVAGWRDNGLASLREGFVFYGGFIGASVATIIYCWRQRLPLWKVADVFAPSVALGHAFGRLGCFFNGCCSGKACDLPWAVRFPGHVAAVHPTQLYEVAGNLVIFAALSSFYRHRKFDGQIWWLYVLSYGALRFVVEFFRGDYSSYLPGGFTIGQAIATVLMLVALVGLNRRSS